MTFHVIQGNIDDDVESDTGAMPVQLPLTFHALRMKEKEAESAVLEADVKGAILYWLSYYWSFCKRLSNLMVRNLGLNQWLRSLHCGQVAYSDHMTINDCQQITFIGNLTTSQRQQSI